jgi:hypothetical protein
MKTMIDAMVSKVDAEALKKQIDADVAGASERTDRREPRRCNRLGGEKT